MTEPESARKLAAILSADVVGYSRLMADDESATVQTLADYRRVFAEHIGRHHGRVVDAPGDNLLAEFASPVEALACATEVQGELARRNRQLAEHRRMQFRIGINLGDVIEKEAALYGEGVNLAARLEGLADPGGICISDIVKQAVEGKLDLAFDDLGERQVKNVAKPVRAWRVSGAAASRSIGPSRIVRPRRGWYPLAGVAVVLLVGAAVAIWRTEILSLAEFASPQDADDVLGLPEGPSIAVLPFANLSGSPEREYFADGITEDIITELSRFRDLFVIARNSTLPYKGRPARIEEVRRDLGVRYVLEGSVRTTGERMRVTAQLIDAASEAHLWAETYDRDLSAADVFAVQDDIKQKVVGLIAGEFGIIARAEIERIKYKPTESLDAYECILRAQRFRSDAHTKEEHLVALRCMDRAVELDPNYADAWAWRAYVYSEAFVHDWAIEAGEALARALDYSRRALELDPTSQMARQQLAYAHFYRGEKALFLTEAERAIALNPNNAVSLAGLGSMLRLAGQPERGVALVRKAIALNPNHPGWYHFALFGYHYDRREYAAALAEALKVNIPGFWANHMALAQAYAQLGRLDEARAAGAKLLELNPEFPHKARQEFAKFFFTEEHVEHALAGLRKAGIEFPAAP
jgi:adenylate cyclase